MRTLKSISLPPSGYVRFFPARARALPDQGGYCKRLRKKLLGGMLQLPEKKREISMDCTSLIIVPILTDRETYRHNSNYLKLCKSSGPLVIPALPEATLFREPLGAFRGLG